ncbi:protein PBDC1 isoform X2 [Protopterus annectens]|uniref:protein PBDC1 isoform X2 n=1 Tax=Protopterus annectens TaxID=7888 RepID=UPI001CFAD5D7|nr:protein PBDC1 isoform X2 [Protopterus annectens]
MLSTNGRILEGDVLTLATDSVPLTTLHLMNLVLPYLNQVMIQPWRMCLTLVSYTIVVLTPHQGPWRQKKSINEQLSEAHALSQPAEAYGNDPNLEMMWAMKAYQHAEVYFNLISSVDPQFLRLTKVDDVIYKEFREAFGSMKIDILDPAELKSDQAKELPGFSFLPLK